MSQATLFGSAAAATITALLYLYVGRVLRNRQVSPEARLANSMFVLWWEALAGLSLVGAVAVVLYASDLLEIWMYQTYLTLVLLVLFVALWGLQFYLVYLYTGSKVWLHRLGIFYAVLFLFTLGLFNSNGAPTAIVDDGWSISTQPTFQLAFPFDLIYSVILVGPAILGAAAYALLFTKTRDRTQKFRIAIVTGSILIWFGSSLTATALGLGTKTTWEVANRFISIMAALAILVAFKPPAWLRAKFGLQGPAEEPVELTPAL